MSSGIIGLSNFILENIQECKRNGEDINETIDFIIKPKRLNHLWLISSQYNINKTEPSIEDLIKICISCNIKIYKSDTKKKLLMRIYYWII